jgi:hypothetical protein
MRIQTNRTGALSWTWIALWNESSAVFTMEVSVPYLKTESGWLAVHNFHRDPNRPVGGAGAVAGRASGPC